MKAVVMLSASRPKLSRPSQISMITAGSCVFSKSWTEWLRNTFHTEDVGNAPTLDLRSLAMIIIVKTCAGLTTDEQYD